MGKPVLGAGHVLTRKKPSGTTRIDKDVNYFSNRRDTVEPYLEEGRCSFTNNLIENEIRSFVIGQKNWLFSSFR